MFYFCLLILHHGYFSFLINCSSPSGPSVSSGKVPHSKHVQSFSVLRRHCPRPYSWQAEHESLCEPQLCPPIAVGSWEFSAEKCWALIPQGSRQWVLWFTTQVSQQFLSCGLLDLNDWRVLPLWLMCVVLLLQVLDNAIETEKMIEKYSPWLLTCWSGLSKPLSSSTIANLPTPWLGCSSSCRRSTLNAQWRNHPSEFNLSLTQQSVVLFGLVTHWFF